MDKSKQPLAGSKTAAASKWADHAQVTENSKHKGIELLFNNEPSHELQSKLRACGFRPSKVKNMWYSDNNPSTKAFALEVQSTISSSVTGPDLFLSPSFEASRTNIEKKEFSFILITLKDGQIKNYIVFEPSKPKAEVIATQFSREQFGDNFSALAAKPRTQVREARMLFDEGKIIFPKEEQALRKAPTKASPVVTTELKDTALLETAADKTRELEQTTIQKFYRWAAGKDEFKNKTDHVSRNVFNDWLKENAPEISQTSIENMWRSHERIVKSMNRIQKRSKGKGLIQPYSNIYKKLLRVIPDLIKHLEEGKHSGQSAKDPKGGLMDLHFDYLGKDKKGNYLIALAHYFKQNGDRIADPDMQIRILPEMEAAEAMTYQDQFGYQEVYPDKGDGKEYVDLRRKKELNKFLNQWLSNIIRQGHKIELTQSESEVKSSEEGPDHYFHLAYDQLLQLIPELLSHLKGGIQKGELNDNRDETQRKIEVRLTSDPDQKSHTIQFNESIDGKETLQSELTIVPADKQAYVTAEWLSFYYAGKYDREESEDEIDDRDGDIGEEMTRGFTEWLDDVLELDHHINLTEEITHRLFTEKEELNIHVRFHARGLKSPFNAAEAFFSNLPVIDLAFRYGWVMDYFKEHIEIPRLKKIEKFKSDLGKLKGEKNENEKRNALKKKIEHLEGEINSAEKLVEDENLIFQDNLYGLILTHAKKKGYEKEIEKDVNGFREYILTNILDNRAIENYPNDRVQKVVNELLDEYIGSTPPTTTSQQNTTPSSGKAITTNLETEHTFLSNVLVPAGTSEPFLSQIFRSYDVKSILKTNFPHLLKINDDNVFNASALELFELLQMDHPTNYGIKVDRRTLLEIWEERGKEFFDTLGLPTDPNYPYIHILQGYRVVKPLKEILSLNNDRGNDWGAVAQYWRPIADVKEGLPIIDDLIIQNETIKKRLEANNPKTHFRDLTDGFKVSKVIIQKFIGDSQSQSKDEIKAIEVTKDTLANKHGIYTEESAGENYEQIIIPMPKSAHYEAEIRIAKRSDGAFMIGIYALKKFGDHSGTSYAPGFGNQTYSSKVDALRAGVTEHKTRIEQLLVTKDSTLNNEEKKNKQLTAALNALNDFAKANDLSIDKKDTTVISGLETAYWTEKDDARPLNKAMINGTLFHQKRLIQLMGEKLEKLPLPVLEGIAQELSEKFAERKPLSTYEENYVTIGKEGDARKAALIVIYIDDLIFRTDLLTIGHYPVLTYLIELLFSDSPKLADFPQHIEKHPASKIKKQSQHELNREIEALIDRKDQSKESFNQEEKNRLRLYSGSGGLIKQGATGKGILYEYYTPDTIIKKMWDLAYHFGYDGGSVLEPSVGTGNFLKYAPKSATLVGYEVNHYAARIAQILYPAAQIHEAAFETIFFAGNVHLKDEYADTRYSLVIGNPHYGEFSGRYAGMGEKKWTRAFQYELYFTLRGLDLLKSGGLLIYIIPSNFSHSFGDAIKIAAKSTGLDRYYLGTGIFKTTDIETDIIVLRKN